MFSTLEEYSGFANATYEITPKLDVTGGIRIGKVNQTNFQTLSGSNAVALNRILALGRQQTIPAITPNVEFNDTVKTYLATARYRFSSDGIVFARFATGFRPGGPNIIVPGLPPSFDPDRTTNYEVGVKTKFLDGRGSIDVTGYYTQWKDILVVVSAGGLSGFTNGGNARVYGVESALTLRPTDELTLRGTFAYSKGKITSAAASAATALADGDPLPYNPKTSGSFFAEYRTPVSDDWSIYANGLARFTGSRFSTFRSRTTAPGYILPPYALVDLHAGLDSDNYTIDLFVKNLTDKRAQQSAITTGGIGEINIQRPRTIGVAGTVKF